MFKQLLSDNRIFIAAVCLLVFIAGGLIYLQVVKSHARRDVQRTQEMLQQKQLPKPQTEAKPPPPGETAETGHWHGDVWHAEPHQTPAPTEDFATSEDGHWSDAYLPPLEELKRRYADDAEAMLILNNVEILQKYGLHSNHPEAGKARTALTDYFHTIFDRINIRGNPEGLHRVEELLKLKWSLYDSPPGTRAELAQWAPLKGE